MIRFILSGGSELWFTKNGKGTGKMKQTGKIRRTLCVILVAGLVCLSGCTDKEVVQQKEVAVPQEAETSGKMETFNGTKRVKGPDGQMWTPPAGSHTDADGYVLDKDGCVIGKIGPLRISPNAVG